MVTRTSSRRSDWKWWGLWVLVSLVGWAAGLIVLVVLFRAGGIIASILGLGLFGVIAGLPQWLILRLHIPRAGWWILATTAGAAAGATLGFLIFIGVTFVTDLLDVTPASMDQAWTLIVVAAGTLVGAAFGSSVGIAQSIALPWHVRDTGWWVLACTVGGILDGLLVGTVARALDLGVNPADALLGTLGTILLATFGGPLKGILTGWALTWLLQERP